MRTEPRSHSARASADPTSPPKVAKPIPAWWWVAVAGCLAAAAVLRIWGAASNNGYGNSYYSAVALSMSKDWSTFFTGGLDTGHFLSMDKPAVYLWPSALLIKLFGLNWATLFLPSVLAGVASVLVLALAVREGMGDSDAGRAAALVAALGLAVSPMNVAIDRNNNPDALMLLALLLAAWMLLRAVRRGRLLPLLGSAALVGLAFDAKYVQAYIVVPALALVWLVSGVGSMRRRLTWLGGAAASLLAASAAWPVLVALMPSERRPWVGGSTDGTVFDRVTNAVGIHIEPSSGGPEGPAGQVLAAFHTGEVFHSGTAGPGRLFSGVLADQISWWLPLALVAVVTLALGLRGRSRTDPAVAGLVLWSGWTLCCWGVFSFMGGVLHPYYVSMLVPALAALAAAGMATAWTLWRRGEAFGTVTLVVQVLVVAGWSASVLRQTSAQTEDWMAPLVIVVGVAALFAIRIGRGGAVLVAGVLAAAAALTAPITWSVKTTDQPLQGFNPLANQAGRYRLAVLPPPLSDAFMGAIEQQADGKLLAFLERNRGDARWLVATLTSLPAAPLIIASDGKPVMAMGGFDGADPTPTLARFQALVKSGELRFVLAPPPGPGTTTFITGPAVQVTQWALKACSPIDPATGKKTSLPAAPPQGSPPAGPSQGGPPQGGPPPGGPPQGGPPPGGPPPPILLDCRGTAA